MSPFVEILVIIPMSVTIPVNKLDLRSCSSGLARYARCDKGMRDCYREMDVPRSKTAMINRHFLFLQGPHGPFFRQLAKRLRRTDIRASKVGFNSGDRIFWSASENYHAFRQPICGWPDFLKNLIATEKITDIVLYGEGRPVHDTAIALAKKLGLTTHIFEEGYLRPYWVTYERDGSNGNSPLCKIPLAAMRSELPIEDAPESAVGWGDLREHVFYGAIYHAALMAGRAFYPNYQGHREISVGRETYLNIARFLVFPFHAIERRAATARLRLGGFPYHLALLQLEHDASFRGHGQFETMAEFADSVIHGFAKGGSPHHHLIFKAHPLEDGRGNIRLSIKNSALRAGIADRVHFLSGGKLAGLLDDAISAVTLNSTAGQQVLRRGIPLKSMGEAVYSGRGFTSPQALEDFFRDPIGPDLDAYKVFRRFQLETCQIPGGYYATFRRAKLYRRVVDMMLSEFWP